MSKKAIEASIRTKVERSISLDEEGVGYAASNNLYVGIVAPW